MGGGANTTCFVHKQNIDLINFYKNLINIRKNNKVLTYGSFEEVYCKNNVIIFKRVLDNQEILCVFNNSDNRTFLNINSKLKAINLITEDIEDLNNIDIESFSFKVYKMLK